METKLRPWTFAENEFYLWCFHKREIRLWHSNKRTNTRKFRNRSRQCGLLTNKGVTSRFQCWCTLRASSAMRIVHISSWLKKKKKKLYHKYFLQWEKSNFVISITWVIFVFFWYFYIWWTKWESVYKVYISILMLNKIVE